MNTKLSLAALALMLAGSSLPGCSNAATPMPTPTPTELATAHPPAPSLTPIPTVTLITISPGGIAYNFCSGDSFGRGEDFRTCEIYIMNADGSKPIRLTDDDTWDCCPAWSPDGTRIVFVSFTLEPWSSEISIINADGTGQKRLTNDGRFNHNPSWSPDGSKLIFDAGERGGRLAIYVMNPDGSDPTRLTDGSRNDSGPAWSPDGTSIAYSSAYGSGLEEIYLMNADGGNPVQLTDNDRQDLYPAWSPDGTRIAFVAYETDGIEEIYVMNADGSNPMRLTDNSASDRSPAWSPDGSQIAFASNRDGSSEIYVMNADGSDPTRLTFSAGSGIAGEPAWALQRQNPAVQPANCTSGWSRLSEGSYAVVTGGSNDPPNRVRASPSTSADVIAQIYGGTIIRVLEGPVCADGLVFWKVENGSIPGETGWTAEGDGTEHYLEPYRP